MTKFLNTDLDSTLGGLTPSDEKVSSQKAVKTYVDDADAKKVDKTSTASQVYVTNASGNQSTLSYSQSNSADSIAQRDADGQITVNQTPTANDHAASKKYVDDGLSDKQAVLVSGTNIKTVNNQSLLGSGNIDIQTSSPLPDMTDQSGKYLTTDGTSASWNALATVATSGSYTDLTDKPTIPAAQQQVDWNASSGITSILNKPTLSEVATSGDYTDLSNKPTINDLTTTAQQDALNSGATSTNIAQIATNQADISTINGKIPSAASTSNQLADKAFVNSSVSNMAANYVTSDAQGDNFATKAALLAGPYYYKGQSYTLTNNDYALVESDETKENATTRYVYDGAQWAFQYIVNNTPFTQAQLDAINSTITSNLVSSYSNHIADTDIHVTAEDKSNWNGKQAAITGAASTVTSSNLTANRVLVSNSSGKITAHSSVTSAELGYLDGVTSNIQVQLNNKANSSEIPTKVSQLTNDSGYALSSNIGNGTVTIVQDGVTKGTFTLNQSGDTTVTLTSGIGLTATYDATNNRITFA